MGVRASWIGDLGPILMCPYVPRFPCQIISKDLWPNPLKYYVKSKAPQEESHRRTGAETGARQCKMCCQGAGALIPQVQTVKLKGTQPVPAGQGGSRTPQGVCRSAGPILF